MAQMQKRHAFLLLCCLLVQFLVVRARDDVSEAPIEENDAHLASYSMQRSELTSISIRRLYQTYEDREPVYLGMKWWQLIIVVFFTLLCVAGITCCCMILLPLLGLDCYLGGCDCCCGSGTKEKKEKKDRSHRHHRDEDLESEALQEDDDEDEEDEDEREREEYERERQKRKRDKKERRRDREERRRIASEERRRDSRDARRRDVSEERRRDVSDEDVEPSGCCGGQQTDRKDRKDKRRHREDEEWRSQLSMEMARSDRHGAREGVYSYRGSPYDAEIEQTQQDGTYNRYADVFYSGQQMQGGRTQPTYGFSGEGGTVPLPSFPIAHDHTGRSLGKSPSPTSRTGGVQAYQSSDTDAQGRRVLETIVHEPVRETDSRGYVPSYPAPNSFAGSLLNRSYAPNGQVSALSLQEQLAQAAAPKFVGEVVHEPVVPERLGEVISSGNFAQSGLATSVIPANFSQSLSSAPHQSYQASYDARTPKMLIL